MAGTFTEADVRRQQWERDIKGFAPKRYVMKEIVMIQSSGAWTNSFFQKTATSLVGGEGSDIKGIPRGGEFPFVERPVTLKSSVPEQYGAEGVVYWQDILTSNISQQTEVISNVTDGVVNDVDGEIYGVLSEDGTPVTINSITIAAGFEWDSATIANRDPVQNLLDAVREITIDRYPILTSGQGFLLVNETDYANLMGNSKVINHPTFKLADGIIRNGNLAMLTGLRIKVSPVVPADEALVVMAKRVGTWKQISPLIVDVINEPQKRDIIRASEFGVTQLTDPEASCIILNTRK